MLLNWFPWKYVVRRVALAKGFIDPITVLSRLHRFAEPSEVAAPLELLRAGVVFHARGLMNSEAIQHNLDWIWPYWIQRQFDPCDISFLPRAFSITHVNLTHRNWTAVGIPGCEHLPIVDPRGLLTPFWDSWSIDGWIFGRDGERLIPSREQSATQHLDMTDGVAIVTETKGNGMHLRSTVDMIQNGKETPVVRQRWWAKSQVPASLVISARPYNPEGVSFIHHIHLDEDFGGWRVGERGRVGFSHPADEHFTSDYKHGDVSAFVETEGIRGVDCPVGMATAAAIFALDANHAREIELTIPLDQQNHRHWLHWPHLTKSGEKQPPTATDESASWSDEICGLAKLDAPDERFMYLHDAAIRTLILHMPGEVYPGPYTYKRFWVRDTAFILNAALCVGMFDRTANSMPALMSRQNSRGYFRSQDGEWDSNGQALWLMDRFCDLSNQPPPPSWKSAITRAAGWIDRKRLPNDSQHPARGLLPAGFSAEHLGPNDNYYWDDFWSVAGLRSAAKLLDTLERHSPALRLRQEANDLQLAIERSLQRTDYLRKVIAYPAAPARRMDAGAIGSVVASYPLQLVASDDQRMKGLIEFLREHCMVDGGFFQDMIHSGINPYLTLHIAQVMLRQGDEDWFQLVDKVAQLASPTGQWPEAIHPKTAGGCMGDGQHAWAAAEWLMAIRNMFVREEGNSLVIGSGIPQQWQVQDRVISYGPTATPWGKLRLTIQFSVYEARICWQASWHRDAPLVEVSIPGYRQQTIDMSASDGTTQVEAMLKSNKKTT